MLPSSERGRWMAEPREYHLQQSLLLSHDRDLIVLADFHHVDVSMCDGTCYIPRFCKLTGLQDPLGQHSVAKELLKDRLWLRSSSARVAQSTF